MSENNEGDWGIIESFGVDNGELDGLTPAQCFTLGVEWERFYRQLLSDEPFKMLVNAHNCDRIQELVKKHARKHNFENQGYGWWEIIVGDRLS